MSSPSGYNPVRAVIEKVLDSSRDGSTIPYVVNYYVRTPKGATKNFGPLTYDVKTYGKPSVANLEKFVKAYIKSFSAGGANVKISEDEGYIPIANRAELIGQKDGTKIEWKAPAFMVLDSADRNRKEFSSVAKAVAYAKDGNGGRIAVKSDDKGGKAYWYSMEYTMGDIAKDIPGNVKIGTFKDFSKGGQFADMVLDSTAEKDEPILDAVPKLKTLNFGDQIDQNRKAKEGKGKAAINDETHAWADKKFGGAHGSTVTEKGAAISKQKIEIHKPEGRMGVMTITITPFGDYLMVRKDNGEPGKSKTEYYAV